MSRNTLLKTQLPAQTNLVGHQSPQHGKVRLDGVSHFKSWKKTIHTKKTCLSSTACKISLVSRQDRFLRCYPLYHSIPHLPFYLVSFSSFQDHKSTKTGLHSSLKEKGGSLDFSHSMITLITCFSGKTWKYCKSSSGQSVTRNSAAPVQSLFHIPLNCNTRRKPCGKMADWFKRLQIPERGQSQIQEYVTAEIVHDLLIAEGSDPAIKSKGQRECLVPIAGIRFLSRGGEDSQKLKNIWN